LIVLAAAAGGGKGFGANPEPPPKKEKEATVEATQAVAPAPAPRPQNEGQKALASMRRQRAEQKDDELRKVRDMLAADKQIEQAPAVIPERVAQRMGKRMLPFVGIPLIGGMGSFVLFWYLATYKNYEFQPAMVAFSTIAILAVSLVVSAHRKCVTSKERG
jgi:type IV secretory pathway VirB10-like protein